MVLLGKGHSKASNKGVPLVRGPPRRAVSLSDFGGRSNESGLAHTSPDILSQKTSRPYPHHPRSIAFGQGSARHAKNDRNSYHTATRMSHVGCRSNEGGLGHANAEATKKKVARPISFAKSTERHAGTATARVGGACVTGYSWCFMCGGTRPSSFLWSAFWTAHTHTHTLRLRCLAMTNRAPIDSLLTLPLSLLPCADTRQKATTAVRTIERREILTSRGVPPRGG